MRCIELTSGVFDLTFFIIKWGTQLTVFSRFFVNDLARFLLVGRFNKVFLIKAVLIYNAP